ncbi:hypothetical protein SAY87_008746 [Trapa incisa]|uniref:ABC transporter B family member 8 n=1 Tax=Trapa incisa TaxID=236973 RepID=A0AAN7JWG1_9MYRT|nr:hypothetical protein SAY87_008746 [Trapa incisa]
MAPPPPSPSASTSSGEVGKVGYRRSSKSVAIIFRYADWIDVLLMVLGTVGAIGDGMSTNVLLLFASRIMNSLGYGGGGTGQSSGSTFMAEVEKCSLYFVYLGLAVMVVAFMEGYCWSKTSERQVLKIRYKYLESVLRQEVGFFDSQEATTSEIIDSISKETSLIGEVLGEKVPIFLMHMSVFVSGLAFSTYFSWRLSLVAFPLLLLLIIPGMIYGKYLLYLSKKSHTEYAKANTVIEQALSSIKTVYSFTLEKRIIDKYSEILERTTRLGVRMGIAKGLAVGSTGLSFAIWAFLAWYGSRLVMYKGESGGRIYAAGVSFILCGLSLGMALPDVKYFIEATVAATRIFHRIDRVPEIDGESAKGITLGKISGEVVFEHVNFTYPSRPDSTVLRDFNLRIQAGKTVALVGASGSGKSTAIALLQRFYNPDGGAVRIDGVDIRNLQLKWIRQKMGLVSQEHALFGTSIRDNILFGKLNALMEEVTAAAMAANAHDFIRQLPEGYETKVVAHKLSTVRNADLIAVVNGGSVVELGSHEDLIDKQNGQYARLAKLQRQLTYEHDHHDYQPSEVRPASAAWSSAGCLSAGRKSGTTPAATTESPRATLESPPRKPLPAPSFSRLVWYSSPEWRQGLVGCLSAAAFGAVQPVYAITIGGMISAFFLPSHEEIKSRIRTYALIFSGLSLVSITVNLVQHYNFAYMGERLTKRIRQAMLEKILSFEAAWFDEEENSSGALCSRLSNEASMVKSLVADRVSLLVQTTTAVTLAMVLGLVVAWKLALVMIAVQPLTILCFYTRKVLLSKLSSKFVKAQSRSTQIAVEAVVNHRIVTSFGSIGKVLELFDEAQDAPRKEVRKKSWLAGIGMGSAQCLTFMTWALDFWFGGKLVEVGQISAGDVFKTFFILVSTGKVIAEAGSMTSDLAKGSAAVASVFQILDRQSLMATGGPSSAHAKGGDRDTNGTKLGGVEGRIEVRDVDFSYPGRPGSQILRRFSLEVMPGTGIGLVGRSGCGKSTVIGLIQRFYDVDRGSVRVDGVDIRELDIQWYRRHTALVSQEPVIYSGNIRDNIMFGKPDADESEVVEAAKAANAHEFISSLNDGYGTECGERGVQLSGGQKQRIAIARAIIRNPTVLLLDEATSALDVQSEQVVQEALDRIMVGRTTIVVAHRLNTIEKLDSIAVVVDGKVAERGTYAQLKKKRGAFVEFANHQL